MKGPCRRLKIRGDPRHVAVGTGLAQHDVYANLAGGLSVSEPGLDLPLALALASSLRDRPLVPGTVAIGEVGLAGEVRRVSGVGRRDLEPVLAPVERARKLRRWVHHGSSISQSR